VVSLYSEINDSLITQINSGNTTQFSIANLSSLERKQPYKLTLRAIDNPMTNNIGKDFIFLFTIGNNNLINCTLPQDLGSSAININDIQLYPNPVNNQLYFANVPANSTIQVYNLQGQVTIDKQLKTSELNMNELKQGLYFYKLFDQHGVNIKSGKIVKD
jgi:hypothetical protein